MEEFSKNIEVLGTLGEGSFGRVYKAKQKNGNLVAVKVISKRGRSTKEIKGFRRECEIQRYLHHPNIIQMLDSFETDNEIFVITEFAHKELTAVLSKEGYLPENRVQAIVWDLVSALNYLHSNRVLHRDLKPQNILLDVNHKAKLCDFGFARNMSTGTHVLTSIKGTPLYMAPELIDEKPYDHNADLWSLGCIIYELLNGTPPFSTCSILHLIRMIKDEHIKWPSFLSPDCTSFLKGLLQKNPSKRMTWEQILNHPFVKGHILITKNATPMPLTEPLTASLEQVKEQQRKESIQMKKAAAALKIPPHGEAHKKVTGKKSAEGSKGSKDTSARGSASNNKDTSSKENTRSKENDCKKVSQEHVKTEKEIPDNKSLTEYNSVKVANENSNKNVENSAELKISKCLKDKLNFIEDNHPIESEEWIVFLQKSIHEVMNGETTSLTQANLTNIILSPLKNVNANSKVLCYVARLLCIAFVVKGISGEVIEQIKKVYYDVKLVPNLVYSTKLLLRKKPRSIDVDVNSSGSTPSPTESLQFSIPDAYKSMDELEAEDLTALEHIYMLVCHLVHLQDGFLTQFCDAVAILNVGGLMNMFLNLSKKRLRIVLDVMSILTHIIRVLPENSDLVEKILLNDSLTDVKPIHFVEFMRHSNPGMRARTCFFILHMGKYFQKTTLDKFWTDELKDTLEALMFDSIESVRNAAEMTVNELKHKEFYMTGT